jgi:hypothetical protein
MARNNPESFRVIPEALLVTDSCPYMQQLALPSDQATSSVAVGVVAV